MEVLVEILVGALLVMQVGSIACLWWLWKNIRSIREKTENDFKQLSGIVHLQAQGSRNLTKLVSDIVQTLVPTNPTKPKPEGKVIPWKDHPA